MLRTVADDTPSPASRTSSDDATGSPEAMYSQTRVASTRFDRSLSSISTLGPRLLTALYNAIYVSSRVDVARPLSSRATASSRPSIVQGFSRNASPSHRVGLLLKS